MLKDVTFNESKPKIDVIFETQGTKEIRIASGTNQLMKEHKKPFPIVIQIVQGKINFGVKGEKLQLNRRFNLA